MSGGKTLFKTKHPVKEHKSYEGLKQDPLYHPLVDFVKSELDKMYPWDVSFYKEHNGLAVDGVFTAKSKGFSHSDLVGFEKREDLRRSFGYRLASENV